MDNIQTADTDPRSDDNGRIMIVGLGNPGRKHRHNRHNFGFIVLDEFASLVNIEISKNQSQALIGDGRFSGRHLFLVKPMTYMNLSGQPVSELSRYYKIQTDNLIVVYDEIDLPLGSIRIRPAGGSGGHNGMKSIIQHIGHNFPRLRLGVGRPPGRMDPADYVLKNFSKTEAESVDIIVASAVEALKIFVLQGLDLAMNRFNQLPEQEQSSS